MTITGRVTRLLPFVSASAMAIATLAVTASVTLATPAARSALRSYDDKIDDVVTAPDISGSSVVTNDNFVLTIGMRIRGRSSFLEGDVYAIFFDTDTKPRPGRMRLGSATRSRIQRRSRARQDMAAALARIVVRAADAAHTDRHRMARRNRPRPPDRTRRPR